jgi:outer membrane immunogenic protein
VGSRVFAIVLFGMWFACADASAARAADISLPLYRPSPVITTYGWAGCYLGLEGGGAWGTSQHEATNAGPFSGMPITGNFGISGTAVGGTAGCNLQSGDFVFGVENDLSWTDTNGGAYENLPFDPFAFSQTKMNWLDTLRGRAGIASDRWFGYLTAGAAFAGTTINVCNGFGCVGDSRDRIGWTLGAGVEYALIDNWTVKLEYLYANFGAPTYLGSGSTLGGLPVVPRNVPLSESLARVGVNYRFGPAR